MMFSEQFLEQDSYEIEYNGRKVNAFYTFDRMGEHILKFSFVSTASEHLQAIVIHWDSFEGQMFINGTKVEKPKNRFPQTVIAEKYAPVQFEIKVVLESGKFRICNGSDLLGDEKIWRSLYGGCAMIIEELGENHFRMLCNDHDNDDDFDDLVFELEVLDFGKVASPEYEG